MNDGSTNWLILKLALERQQRLLREAGLERTLHQARIQNQPEHAQASGFRMWLAHALRFRTGKRVLEKKNTV
jgi:hypothetical protein